MPKKTTVVDHPNLSGYEGVEAFSNFPDNAARNRYRVHVLEKSLKQAHFIGEQIGQDLDVFEACTGNGRLGFALIQEEIASFCLGIDIAESRIAFARQWAKDLDCQSIRFEQADLLTHHPERQFDLVLCVTGAFGYFDAIQPGTAALALRSLAEHCKKGGYLVLELYNHPSLKKRCLQSPDRLVREWNRLPPDDPFEYHLHEFHLDPTIALLTHHKIFIHRHPRMPDMRSEVLRLYEPEELRDLLTESDFEIESIFPGWDSMDRSGSSEHSVIVAKKVSG